MQRRRWSNLHVEGKRTKPNVLLITTDQQRGDCVGFGPRGVRTPNLDRLAQRGARFDTCITPNPMCQVARASILTGKLPYDHGVRDNGYDLDPAQAFEGLGGVFSEAGYRTSFIGKAHFATHMTVDPTGSPECDTSAAEFGPGWTGPYFGFAHAELTLRPHLHSAWAEPPTALNYEEWLNQDGRGAERWGKANEQDEPKTKHQQVWRSSLPQVWHTTAWCGDRVITWLEDAGEESFFCWLSFPDPHPPFVAPFPWAQKYDPATVDLPEHRSLDLENRPWWHRAFIDGKANKARELGLNLSSGSSFDDKDLRDITAVYYGMIEAIDAQIGRVIDKLAGKGLLDNTIIVFTSDHGEWLGDHGLLLKGPMLYDGLLRVPLVIAGPGIPRGAVIDAPVSTLDLRTTLTELCAVEAMPDQGASLLPLLLVESDRDHAYAEWCVEEERSGVALDLRTVRTQKYRMSLDMISGDGELYAFERDPHECCNLFNEADMQPVVRDLTDRIKSRAPIPKQTARRVGWH